MNSMTWQEVVWIYERHYTHNNLSLVRTHISASGDRICFSKFLFCYYFMIFFSVVVGMKNMADLLPKCIKLAIKQQKAKN